MIRDIAEDNKENHCNDATFTGQWNWANNVTWLIGRVAATSSQSLMALKLFTKRKNREALTRHYSLDRRDTNRHN